MEKEEFKEKDKLYEELAKKYEGRDELFLRLFFAEVGREYLAYKFKISYDEVQKVADNITIGPACHVYFDLLKVENRTWSEENFCRNMTAGYIAGKINNYVKMAKEYHITVVDEDKLKMYMSLSPEAVKAYAYKVIDDNLDKETGRLKVGIPYISF